MELSRKRFNTLVEKPSTLPGEVLLEVLESSDDVISDSVFELSSVRYRSSTGVKEKGQDVRGRLDTPATKKITKKAAENVNPFENPFDAVQEKDLTNPFGEKSIIEAPNQFSGLKKDFSSFNPFG